MRAWRFIKFRVIAVAAGISILFIGLQIVYGVFFTIMNDAIEVVEKHDYEGAKYGILPDGVMPTINDLLQKTAIIPLMIIAFIAACIVPVLFIVKDYYENKSIRTIMRLPIPKTYYYLDKLFPPTFLLGIFWLMQWGTLSTMARLYIAEVPVEKVTSDVWMTVWNYPPARLLYPFSDLSHMPAALSFLILVPATVILFVLAERSKKRGIFSGVIACSGIIAILMHLLDLPASTWVVPSITATVLIVGIWHVNRIQIA